ncbi:hypothetical protein HS088_TW11G00136 [Tripterygium wilfordii]|uniref:Pentatricopeptide repeat-containing protein n=1 Tax=Tripterygium wilfordii TaxID=458696 RepID=A0A7J7D129_TRIWF|nr:putative pentatricopeptide repeat-containing protein At3g05240 [Tripterygium wilfordii]KAF5740072.1 hypothetical protein HS088_TW11G00136 [Tripterygium wilfordii]
MKKHYNTILSLLESCKTFGQLKQIHGLTITTTVVKNIIPLSRLIDFCTTAESRNLSYAKLVFSQIDQPSVYIWNCMIRGYSGGDKPYEALILCREMQRRGHMPDNFTFPFVLKACSICCDPDCGRCVHNCIVKTGFEVDVYASTGLLNMYASCGYMELAHKVFDEIPKWNVVAWTSLIAGLVNSNQASEAITVFKEMMHWNVEPNEITMVNVMVSCARTRDIETGKWAHNHIRQLGFDPFVSPVRFNVILATAILDMYAKCGSLKTARDLFDRMPLRNLVAWNSLIAAYSQYGRAKEALGLFFDMKTAGLEPDKATFLSIFDACATSGALALGQALHACVIKASIHEDTATGTALLDMYAKMGDLTSAQQVFNEVKNKDVMAWTSMIIGLAMHGRGEEALVIFKRMQETGTVIPDQITYIGVLCACSHLGLVEEGQRQFNSMTDVCGIVPTVEHYGCMVDLLSRAGRLEEAERFLEKMPAEPSVAIWGALLNGCEIYENVALADRLRSQMTELKQAFGSGVYVLLSNIYARAGRWEAVNLSRDLMKHKRVPKTLGCSSVETNFD